MLLESTLLSYDRGHNIEFNIESHARVSWKFLFVLIELWAWITCGRTGADDFHFTNGWPLHMDMYVMGSV